MNKFFGRITKWFSPRFLAWLRSFALFFLIYTGLAWLLAHTLIYTIPFLIGLGIAIVSQPLIRFATTRLKLKTSLSAWISPLITILLLLGLIGWLGFLGIRELVGLVGRIPNIDPQAILSAVEIWLKNYSLPFDIPALNMDYLMRLLNDNRTAIIDSLKQGLSFAGNAAQWLIAIVTSLPTWIMLIIIVLFSAFSFTKDYDKLKQYSVSLFSEQAIASLRMTWTNGLVMLGKYIRSYLFIYFLTFLQSYILFLVLGIEYPLVWSILVGVSDMIPILGPGTIYLPMGIARLIQGDWVTAVLLIAGWLFITVVRQFVESKVVADSINIHPLFMLAALFIAFQAGSLNMLLYLTFLLVFYNLLKQSGMLHPLFTPPDSAEPANKRRLFLRRAKNAVLSQTGPETMDTAAPIGAAAPTDPTGEMGTSGPMDIPAPTGASAPVEPLHDTITERVSKPKTSHEDVR